MRKAPVGYDRVFAQGMGPAQCTLSGRGVLWPVTLLFTVVDFDGGIMVICAEGELLCGRAGCTPAGQLSGTWVTAPPSG